MPVILLGGGFPIPTAGLTAWWKSDFGVEEANGDAAEDTDEALNWLDYSGNGHTLIAPTKPQYLVNILNGLPVLRFVKANAEYMETVATIASLVAAGAKTIFTVLNTNAVSAGVWYATNGGGADAVSFQTDASDDCISINNDGSQDAITKAATSVALVHTYMHDGASVYSGVSDTRTASLASTASGNTAVLTGVFTLGRVTAIFGDFDIAELIVYNVALTETERQTVEQYLATRYGITLPY